MVDREMQVHRSERYRHGDRLKRPDVEPPVIDLSDARWTIWVCSRCGKQEHELPSSTQQQIQGLRAGCWPTPGMRSAWPHRCGCGGVVREITVMVKPGSWSCPDCGEDMGAPSCAGCIEQDFLS